jgi:hypothetical protein
MEDVELSDSGTKKEHLTSKIKERGTDCKKKNIKLV